MRHKMSKNEMNSKPRRSQGGKGLLSRSISVQNSQESIPLIPREEREEEEQGEGESHGRERRACCSGKRERGRRRLDWERGGYGRQAGGERERREWVRDI